MYIFYIYIYIYIYIYVCISVSRICKVALGSHITHCTFIPAVQANECARIPAQLSIQ